MGKQSNQPTPVSQEQYTRDLDQSLEILHKDGATDQELIDYTDDYKSRFTVAKTIPQKKNPVQSGVSNSDNGSSASQEIEPAPNKQQQQPKMATLNKDSLGKAIKKENSVPKDLSGKSLFGGDKITQEGKNRDLAQRTAELKKVVKTAKTEIDDNLTEERLQTEKEQSGVLNNASKAGKAIWNVTGEALGAINETLGGDRDYLTIDEYKPLQDQRKKAKKELETQGLPTTEEAIQKRSEDIFREEDKMQQLHTRVDANLPSFYNQEGIWKELNIEGLKKNQSLKTAINAAQGYSKELENFNKYADYIEKLPKQQLTQAKIDKYNDFLENAKLSQKGLEHLQESFPKLLKEVKDSEELLQVTKYNYNDLEKSLTLFSNVAENMGLGTLKILAETADYTDEKLGTNADGDTGFREDIREFANKGLNKNREESESFYHYKAKNINNFSDLGSYTTQLISEQAPILATLIFFPEIGLPLLSTGTAGQTFSDMEFEETMPGAKITTKSQKLFTSIAYGTAEGVFEGLGSLKILKNIEKSIARASTSSRILFYDGSRKEIARLGKQTAFSTFIEGGTERLTAEGQIAADRYIAKKDISGQQADEIRSESQTAGAFMGAGMSVTGGIYGAYAQKALRFSDSKDIQDTKKILNRINSLSDELKNNPNLTKEEKKIIRNEMFDLTDKSFEIVTRNAERGKDFSDTEAEFLENINLKQAELKEKFETIKNSNFSKEQKEQFTKELNDQFNSLEGDRNTTLKGEFASIPEDRKTITLNPNNDGRLNDDETGVNSLPLKEREAIKKQAMESLIAELNPDGKKDITITDEQVVKRANEIYANEQTPTPEAKPQQNEDGSYGFNKPKSESKVIIPDEIKDSHSRALGGHQESIVDLEKKLAEEKALPWLKRDKQEQKWIEEDIKFHKERAKLLDENPVQYYKNWLKTDKERHNEKLKEKFKDTNGKTYKEQTIERYGSDKYEDVYSNWIEDVNDQIAKIEEANKKPEKPQEVSPVEDVVDPQEMTDEELLNDLEDTKTEALPEITDQEYLDFVENDFLSDERLNDVAVKVRENKDLTTYEKRIAKKKEKEISGINQKVQDEVNETNRKAEVDTLSKIPSMEKDEFIEYTNSEKASPERLTAIAYKKANNVALNNFEAEVYQDNKKVIDKLNRDKNLKENILDKLPTEQKYKTKEGKLTVAKNGKELELYDTNGQPVTTSPKTKQKYFLEALENGFMKRTEELQYPEGITQAEAERFEIDNETDPSVLLEKLLATDPKVDGSNVSDAKEYAIAIYINKVTQKSFVNFSDKNNITKSIALSYFSKDGRHIDDLAGEISSKMGIEVSPEDIVDFIVANPNGPRNVLLPKNPAYQNLIDKFVSLAGFRPTPSQIMDFKNKEVLPTQIDIEFANEVEVNNQIDDEIIDKVQAQEEFDKWFSNLTAQEQVEFYFNLEEDYPNAYYQQRYNEQQDYEQSEKITSTQAPNRQGETKPDDSVGKNPQQDRPESGNNNVPKRSSGETQNQDGEQGVKPIGQFSSTSGNIYFDSNGIRVNDFKGGFIMNVQSKEDFDGMAMWNIKFDNIADAVKVAEELSKFYPKGVPDAVLLEKVVENIQQGTLKFDAKPTENKEVKEEAPKAEPKQSKRKVRDEQAKKDIADALKEFLKAGRDNLTSGGLSPEKLEKGAKLIALYTKLGIYKFSDIIEDLYAQMGDALKDIYTELKAVYGAHYNTVEDSVADQMDGNIRKVTYESIIDKIKQDEQVEQPIEAKPITDTKPLELKTKAIESKTDKLANDGETKIPTERKIEIVNDLLFDIDTEIENVNDQLRLLGAYEPSANDEMRENAHIYVERELKKDLTNFVKKLNERLKWEFDTDKKGKPVVASANVAPAGGDGTFILWAPNSEYGIYVSLSVQPKEYKEWYEKYELEPSIMWRVTTKKDKYRGLSNQWMNSEDFTIPNLVDKFTKAVSFYLKQENGSNNKQQPEQPSPTAALQPNSKRPSETAPQELLQKPSTTQGTGSRSQSQSKTVSRTNGTVKQSPTGQGDLFSGNANFLEVEPKAKVKQAIVRPINELKAEVELMKQGKKSPEKDAKIAEFENEIALQEKIGIAPDKGRLEDVVETETKPQDKVEVQIQQINQAEKQEPALVDFSLQDNEQEKFNATKKYTDNINALETLLTTIKEKRKATPEEKNTLAKYVGFGGLKEIAFNPDNDEAWKESTAKYKDQVRKVIELTQELDQLLGINNSLAEIRAGILTAHYTPKTIIDTMFNVLEKLGFKNGNILEPSAGTGNFIGYMPNKMRSNSNISAVELDNLTGNILKYLYDDVNTQIKGIQDAIIPDNSQDVVISNVPFGNFKIFDKAFKGNREFLTKRIHNYFFAKALDKVREGGIVMFVTSKGVLDSKGNQNVREYLNQNADFLGAVRLPSTAFQKNANTSVVTDVIILRKNTTGEKKNPNFIDVVDLEVTDKNGEIKTVTINKFFAENRGVLLGDIVPGGMYSEKDYSLADPDNKMGQIWDRTSEMLDQHKGTFQPTTNLNATNRIETDQDLLENTKIGNLTISNEGKILKRLDSEMQEVSLPAYVKPKNVKKYIDVRVALFDLITAEYTGQPDSVVDGLRTKLNSLYLNADQSIPAKEFNRIATEDGDGFNVLALKDATGKKADILSKRTINPLQQKQNTDNIEEAIIISLYENAHIDMDRIAELMNKPVKEILELAKGKIFESPTGGFFTREEYLSGNVKKKLAEVNKAIKTGYTEFENNRTELEAVIPKDIPAVSIEVRLGSRWVPLDIINDFAEHLFNDDNVVINYAKSTDTYNNNGKAHSVNATEKWGTKRKNGTDLLVDALHAATPAIFDTTEDKKRVLNKEETEKAVQKFEEIRTEFENWVYTNAERRERLGAIYNEKYNTTVRRKYEGSHLNIPGINGVNLYPHQKDAIWMLLQNNGGIIDHIVGAGKTYVMVAGTAEMKRTGVAKKPMILALKSTIPQIVETYKQSYPLAKILAPSEKDFQAKNRQKLFSQIALNDWDVIIMSHENYQAIPHSPEYITKQIEDEIAEIEAERDALSSDKKALSGLEKRLKNLETKLEKLTDVAKDNLVYFQQMGIDHIMVDESQQFKNLAYMTKQRNVAGLSKPDGSQRAFNLLIGMRYLQEGFGADKGTTFLSGTPISNSMVEMYSLLKYMRPNKMKELGFNTFDQWATTFANPTNEIEYTVTGQFKSKTRFREFINVPELSLLYNEIADVRNDDNLVLDKPKMKGGDYTSVFIDMSPEQADYGQRIIQFAKTKDGSVLGLDLSENQLTAYMLLATNLSSKMAIDMRLINKDYPYDPNGKVGKLTDEVVKVYQISNEHKGTQLIFSDLGTPKNKNNKSELLKDYMEDELSIPQDTLVEIFGNYTEEGHKYKSIASIKEKAIDVLEIEEKDFDEFLEQARQSGESFNLYSEVKKRLIEKGIPENEIVFIHDYNNQRAKEKLFEKVNAGEIRVILGSTQKLGTGVNVQKRLAAIHHLDVPWRPSDMEQRNGRGLRQGNWIARLYLDNEIPVYAYATIRTLDAYKYQLLQTKENFLRQIKSGSVEDRVIREADDQAGFAVMVAELSGNKDVLLKFKLEQEKERLTKQRRNFEGSLYEAQGKIRSLESSIPAIEENVSKTKKDIESITNKAEYEVTVDKETGNETKKLKIENINGEVLQPEKDSKEAKEKKPVDRIEYGKKAMELIAQTIKTIKLDQYTKSFDINGLPILVKVTNQKEVSNGKESVIQKTVLAILSPSGQTYTVNNSTIPGVLLNQIQKAIESIPTILEMQEKVLDKNKKDLAEYKELAKNDKFPKEEELANVAAELKEVDKRIQDFEKDPDEEAESDERANEKPQDNKIRIGDVVYPNFNEDIDVSVVEGKNLKTNEANYLVKINKQLDYQNEYKKVVEPLFLENGGEWNKSHKAIIFSDKAKMQFVTNEVSRRLGLENDLDNGTRFSLTDKQEPFAEVINGFYSPLEKIIIQAKQAKLPAKQWIEKFAKGEEAKWTGLTDWLSQQQGAVSKADIQQYLKDNRIEIKDVVKASDLSVEKINDLEKQLNKEGYTLEADMGGEGDMLIDKDGEMVDYDEMPVHIKKIYEEYSGLKFDSDGEKKSDTKFSQYQTEGEKENYKEVLVTLPTEKKDNAIHRLDYLKTIGMTGEEYLELPTEERNKIHRDFTKWSNTKIAENSAKTSKEFKSLHFDEPNILVHLRMNTRTDAEGKKVLFLEEVQSDWGQEGKKKGFKKGELDGLSDEQVIEKLGGKIKEDGQDGFNAIYPDRSVISYRKYENAVKSMANDLRKIDGIVSAPFVTDTNSWVKLGLKVALKEAVAQGVDKIAWTTGEQQNDRYDLSKKVDKIRWERTDKKGKYFIFPSKDGNTIPIQGAKTIKEIEDILGKEIAQKIESEESLDWESSDSESASGVLKGVDLQVGGKGMKGFYGSPTEGSIGIIGNVAKSLFKQEPKTTEFDTNEKDWKDTKLFYDLKESLLFEKELEKQGKTGIISTLNPSGTHTVEWNEPRNSTQHSIDITPEMRAEVRSKGLALFKIASRKDTRPFETENTTRATKENLQQEFPDAIVVQSESELPTALQKDIRQQRSEGKVKGVYYNGEVYLVADNNKTIGQATGTYRHEMLGHKGVTDYLANKLKDYTSRIIDNAKGGQLRKLQELAAKYGLPTDLNNLTDNQKQILGEEYIAHISENKSTLPKIWNDLVSFVREALRKLGIKLQVTVAEIQALIGKVEARKKAEKNNNDSSITRFHLSNNKDLRLPQTIARQAIEQWKQDLRNKADNNTKLANAIAIVKNTDWYNDLDAIRQQRVNNTTIKSLLENAIKEINYLEDKIQEYKDQIRDKKITAKQVFDDIIAFLKTNQIKGRITPTEINRLLKAAAQITVKRDTEKALDDFMNLYQVIKEKALLRSDKGAREKAEVDYVLPIVESLVASGYELDMVLDYFETNSQKRMAEIQYHKEKSKFATEEERVNKANETLEKQKQDLFNATYTSFREGLKKARLYWFNLISDRSYVPAELMSKTGMQQTYYQFKNTKGYGHSAKEMYEKVYDKVWKGLSQDKIQLLHDAIQMMRIITIDNNREQNGLAPVQHPNNLSKIDAQAWLKNKESVLSEKDLNDIKKRANAYFKAYTEILDLKLENGFISEETYEALNGLDYQPRMFLHHAVNFDGDLSFEQTRSIETRSGLSKEQVLKLDDGSANSLISDAQWLLSNSISTLYQDIADNTLNQLFIAKELPIAQAKYDDLLAKAELTKEEQRFVKYFKELSDKVIPNEIIGFNASTNDPIYKLDTPKNFVNKYYWADGVKHQFFMEEKLAMEFDGAKGLFLNETNKQVVGNLTGARLVKWFATGNNPLFVIVNTPRDFMWNILVSEHYSSVVPLAMAQMTYQLFPSTYDFIRTKLGRENTDMNLYLQHGGSMDYLHKQGDIADKSFADKYIVKPITSVLGKNNQPIVEDKVKNNYVTKAVGALNEWSELAFRIATFRRSINAQLKELAFDNESEVTDLIDENGVVTQTRKEILDNIYRKATYDARSILDFSQGGRLTKDLEEFIPYLNVGVQATRSYADAMKKRPISTTLKTFQIATGGAAAFITLAMFMLAGDDDEPEEEKGKTVERKYVEFMQGVSEETRSKYYLIPTKQRDEKGNRIANKIAKDQFLIPYTNIVETLIENRIRTRAGFKEVSYDKISHRLYKDIFEYNLSAKTIKDVPLFKAGTAWYAGYDLYRNKPLDKYAKAEALEGMNNPQVEDFYKQLGSQWGLSPIRTKSAIESMITSPQSNPYIATGYEVMDYAFTDKSMEHLGSGVKEMLLKGLKNRTTTKSTEYTRAENLLSDSKKEQLDVMLKEESIRQLYKDKAQEVIDGKVTAEEVLKELESQYSGDPNYRSYTKTFRTAIKSSLRAEGTDGMMQRIKREKSPGAKALMIKEIYGDINSPENEEIKNELIGKRIINAATMRYLDKKTAN